MKNDKKLFGFGRNVFISGLVSFFMDFGSEMIYPLIPLFLSNVLGASKSTIGLIEGIAESTASLLRVFSGWFSDKIGNRKWLMAAGYAISTLSRPLIALATSWHYIFVARFTDRFGKGIRGAPRDALIAESSKSAYLGRAFGLQKAMDTFGAVIGPAVAFLLLGLLNNDYRKVFWISIVPGTIAVLLIILFITERRKKTPLPRSAKPKLTFSHFDGRFRFFTVIMTIFALGNSSDVFLILRAQQVGVPTVMIPVVYLSFNLTYSLSAIPAGMMADRFGRKRIIISGFLLFAVVYYGFGAAKSTSLIWFLFGLYGVFMGLTEGVVKAFLTTIIPSNFKATAFGVYTTAVGLAMFPASLIGGWLWDHVSPAATFYFGAVTALLSALLFIVFIALARRPARKR